MQYPKYKAYASSKLETFEFTSVGINGSIRKIIYFQETENELLYNLAFGDRIELIKDGKLFIEIDDKTVSENGDRDIVLATVADAVYKYTFQYPERWVIFSGTDERRTRLYRMAITKNYDELSKNFHIFGLNIINDEFIRTQFDSNTQFDGFIVKRKKDSVL